MIFNSDVSSLMFRSGLAKEYGSFEAISTTLLQIISYRFKKAKFSSPEDVIERADLIPSLLPNRQDIGVHTI